MIKVFANYFYLQIRLRINVVTVYPRLLQPLLTATPRLLQQLKYLHCRLSVCNLAKICDSLNATSQFLSLACFFFFSLLTILLPLFLRIYKKICIILFASVFLKKFVHTYIFSFKVIFFAKCSFIET